MAWLNSNSQVGFHPKRKKLLRSVSEESDRKIMRTRYHLLRMRIWWLKCFYSISWTNNQGLIWWILNKTSYSSKRWTRLLEWLATKLLISLHSLAKISYDPNIWPQVQASSALNPQWSMVSWSRTQTLQMISLRILSSLKTSTWWAELEIKCRYSPHMARWWISMDHNLKVQQLNLTMVAASKRIVLIIITW